MTRRSFTWMVLASAILLMLAVAAWLFASGRSDDADRAKGGAVVVAADRRAVPTRTIPAGEPVPLPPEMKAALELGDAARLRRPIAVEQMGGIVCGEVSPTGKAADYRRFVYNGAGRTGGIDDGTDVFRKFADKICVMQAGI